MIPQLVWRFKEARCLSLLPTCKMLLVRGVLNVLKINDSTASLKIQGSQVSWSAQATMAKYQSLGSLNNRNVFFSHNSGGWKYKIKLQQGWFLMACRWPSSPYLLTSSGEREVSLFVFLQGHQSYRVAAAATKSLQLCPTLCDPIDSRPPGSSILGILQARTLEWIAISFSNAWKVKSESKVALLCPTLSDPMDCSLPGSSNHGIFQAKVLEWDASTITK